jgi:FdhE protein
VSGATVTRERWLEAHPFLAPIARFQELVDAAAAAVPVPAIGEPRWEAYASEFERGVPLLRTGVHGLDAVAPAAEVLGAIAARLAEAPLPGALAVQVVALREGLRAPEDRTRAIAWALSGAPEDGAPVQGGLVAFLAWAALRRVLAPVIREFGAWRCEGHWNRGFCPTCGAQPGMSQLVSDGSLRHRRLACGCCGTRWKFKRLACPHCHNEEANRLAILELDGEARLRIESCEECKGYVKTYDGEGDEAVLLADWTTLHLDALAAQRGLRRAGASLFAL